MSRVAVIGPGRAGGALAIGLEHAGHRIVTVAGSGKGSPSLASFRRLIPSATAVELGRAPVDVDLVLVAVPDDVIRAVAATVAASGAIPEGQRWVHVSGGHGVDVLSTVAAAGARIAACHPAMSFADASTAHTLLPGVSWAVTARPVDLGWAHTLVRDLGGLPVDVLGANRTLYHAALSIGSNGVTAIATLARDLLLGAGIEDPGAFLEPLVTASAVGGATDGVAALTGPVRRGDDGTVRRHLDELSTSFPETVDSYVALARLILVQAARGGLDTGRLGAVSRALDAAGQTSDPVSTTDSPGADVP